MSAKPRAKTQTAAEKLKIRVQSDLGFHIRRVQGVATLEAFQKNIVDKASAALQGKGRRRIAISACHDVGKTWTCAKIVLAIGSSFPGAKIITTAPSWHGVEKLLWSEIRNGYRLSKYPLGGRMLTTEWKIRDDWFAVGLSPKEESDGGSASQGRGSNFQGFHGDLIVIIFDEATGVPPKRWIQAEGMMTSANVLFIAVGNPTSRSSPFFKCFSSSAWEKIYLSCFDSPNLVLNGVTDMDRLNDELDVLRAVNDDERGKRIAQYRVAHPKLLTLQWVMEKALEWGIDHPLFVSKVLGMFPEEDEFALYPLSSVIEAQAREYTPTDDDRYSIGADIARSGVDKTVLVSQHGHKVLRRDVIVKKDEKVRTTETVGRLVVMIRETIDAGVRPEKITVSIDGTGLGAGVVDGLIEAKSQGDVHRSVEIRDVVFGERFVHVTNERQRKEDEKFYANRKAKLYWRFSQDLKKNTCLPQDAIYQEELPTIVYALDSKGRIVVESKDDYKSRTGRGSPDDTDALVLANEGQYAGSSSGEFKPGMNKAVGRTYAPGMKSGDQW